MTVGSLFAGIGGFDLGFERAGFEIKWQVEIDEYAQRVLAKHWPYVRRYGDIRSIDWATVEPVDVVCGGFPCQPHSTAGARGASQDERDLWPEFARAIRGVRPRWVVAENVSGLLFSESGRFFGRVLGDLASSGYDAEWDCVPASALGAPHRRDRVWILAYPVRGDGSAEHGQQQTQRPAITDPGSSGDVADADNKGEPRRTLNDDAGSGLQEFARRNQWWSAEPNVGRVAHGVPNRVDRLRGLGNAVIPQIPEWIAHRIKEAEKVGHV